MVPVIHGVALNGWQVQNQRMGITWVLVTLMLNVLGATAYAVKVSEQTHSKISPCAARRALTKAVSRALV
jgi:adiponectin receptor